MSASSDGGRSKGAGPTMETKDLPAQVQVRPRQYHRLRFSSTLRGIWLRRPRVLRGMRSKYLAEAPLIFAVYLYDGMTVR